ncbi:MAG: ATP-binding protein [Vicinamibacterales bacterium]
MRQQLFTVALHHDQDVVTARQRAVHITQLLGFDISDQTRVATAVSEIVRDAFRYARGGSVDFAVEDAARPQRLIVRVTDRGPGIPRLEDVLAGHNMVSHNGTAGHAAVQRMREFSYPVPRGSIVLMFSDGLSAHWKLDPYPGLLSRSASLIAGVLYRDFSHRRDDVTVIVAKERRSDSEKL